MERGEDRHALIMKSTFLALGSGAGLLLQWLIYLVPAGTERYGPFQAEKHYYFPFLLLACGAGLALGLLGLAIGLLWTLASIPGRRDHERRLRAATRTADTLLAEGKSLDETRQHLLDSGVPQPMVKRLFATRADWSHQGRCPDCHRLTIEQFPELASRGSLRWLSCRMCGWFGRPEDDTGSPGEARHAVASPGSAV